MSNVPTESGYYWARLEWKPDRWERVRLVIDPYPGSPDSPKGPNVEIILGANPAGDWSVLEWGPKIEPPVTESQ